MTIVNTVIAAGANFGNMKYGGGIGAAYVGGVQKPSFLSAMLNPSVSPPATTWIAKNWSSVPGLMPTTLPMVMSEQSVALRYSVASFTAVAPIDQSFLGLIPATLMFSGWDGMRWHMLWIGVSAGVAGETVTATTAQLADTDFYYVHAFSIIGNGADQAAIASLRINAGAEGLLSPVVPVPFAPVSPFAINQLGINSGNYGYVGTSVSLVLQKRGVLVGAGSYGYVPS